MRASRFSIPIGFAGFRRADAAILFDPDNAQSLVEAIDTVTRGAGGRPVGKSSGGQRLEHFAQERTRAEGRGGPPFFSPPGGREKALLR